MTGSSETQIAAADPQSRPPAPPPGDPSVRPARESDLQHTVWCHIQRSIRYHRAREAFFQFYASTFSFLTLVAGSGVVVSLLAEYSTLATLVFGALVAALQAVELSFQISGKARLHGALASEFLALDRVIARSPACTDDELREIQSDILTIESREPPIKRYLDLICHNQVAISIGSRDIQPLKHHQIMFRNWLSGETAMQGN